MEWLTICRRQLRCSSTKRNTSKRWLPRTITISVHADRNRGWKYWQKSRLYLRCSASACWSVSRQKPQRLIKCYHRWLTTTPFPVMMASCRIRYHSTRRFLRCVRRYATPCTRRIVCASVVNLTAIRWQRGGRGWALSRDSEHPWKETCLQGERHRLPHRLLHARGWSDSPCILRGCPRHRWKAPVPRFRAALSLRQLAFEHWRVLRSQPCDHREGYRGDGQYCAMWEQAAVSAFSLLCKGISYLLLWGREKSD